MKQNGLRLVILKLNKFGLLSVFFYHDLKVLFFYLNSSKLYNELKCKRILKGLKENFNENLIKFRGYEIRV